MSMYEIKARFNSNCDECGEQVNADEQCMFDPKERFVLHMDCHARREANSKSPFRPVQDGVTARFNPPKKDGDK